MEFMSKSTLETQSIAAAITRKLPAGSVIAFSGDLGAGKTCFSHGVCEALRFKGEVSSPTFAIVNVYEGGKMPIYHFDMYRISGWEDLETTGYFDYLDRADGIILVEWSENIAAALPENAVRVAIHKLSDSDRKIVVEGGGF